MTVAYRDSQLVEEAGRLYIQEGLSNSRIAQVLSVSGRAVRKWCLQNDWAAKRKRYLRQETELSELLRRMKLRLARLAFPEEGDLGEPEISPQHLNALCRVVAVLSPPAQVQLRRLDKEEAEAKNESAEERMAKVMELLRGAGFNPETGQE
ncbi:MAG: hypothetical protein AB1641_19730 [Thermodesulfobacteriota bacterium]